MRFGVERHCSRAAFGFQTLNDCQFVWRLFSRDSRRAVSARGERQMPGAIECTAIDTGANRNSCDDFTSFGIEHHNHFVVAAREQTMMHGMRSDSTRSFTRCNRTMLVELMLAHIAYRDFVLVFDVAVNAPRCFIYDREFWISSKRNRRRDRSRFGIDNGDRISSVIENVNLSLARLINNGVWI